MSVSALFRPLRTSAAALVRRMRPSVLIHTTFATAAALIIGLGWAVYDDTLQSSQASREVLKTHELLEAIDDASEEFLLIESAQRGYLLSGQGSFLKDRGSAITQLYLAVDRIGNLTAAEPALYAKVQPLKRLVAERVDIALYNAALRSRIGFRQPWPHPESRSAVDVSLKFKELTDELHEAIHDQLHASEHRQEERNTAARRMLSIAVALSLLVLLPAYSGALRQVRERAQVENRLRDLVQGIPVVAWRLVSRPGRPRDVVFVAEGVKQQRGVDAATAMRDPNSITSTIVEEDRAKVIETMDEAERAMTSFDMEYRVRLPGGRIGWIHSRATLRRSGDGAVLWNGYWDDITTRKELEQKLVTAYKELEAFSYSVSHDLRSPLSTINGFGQLLSERIGPGDAKSQHYLARIRAGARYMSDVIDGLLALAKVGRAVPHSTSVDLRALALEIVAELREADAGREVEFIAADPLRASGDPRMVRQLLANLLDNAWKFTRGRAGARIEFGQLDGDVFFVRDNGVGFEMADAGKLFGAFERLHPGQQFEGTGIGLATVRRIVERHGGKVWAESAPGQGATLFFTLGRRALQA